MFEFNGTFCLDEKLEFPPVELADANGILAIGGDLSPERLLLAYQQGIFPWFNEDDFIIWWSLDPRMVLFPADLKISKSMRSYFNQNKFQVSYNQDFPAVIQACRQTERLGQAGTWISQDIIEAYTKLHKMGHAHSVEVWQNKKLVGGLYGVQIGQVFCGESMFSQVSNASKFGFISLVKKLEKEGIKMIDCQQETKHLRSLGASTIPRSEFIEKLKRWS